MCWILFAILKNLSPLQKKFPSPAKNPYLCPKLQITKSENRDY